MTRPRSDRQIVAAAFRGKLTKPASQMTDAYVHRLAQAVRTARAEGRKPTRQLARGHAPREVGGRLVTTEHPKEYVRRGGEYLPVRKARPSGLRASPTDRHTIGRGIIAQREFRSGYAAWRYLRTLSAGAAQAVAHGEPQPTYQTMVSAAVLSNNPSEKVWRVFYTGTGEGGEDENGATAATYAEWQASLFRIFVPGSVDRYIVRRQG